MVFPKKEVVEAVRARYPVGKRGGSGIHGRPL